MFNLFRRDKSEKYKNIEELLKKAVLYLPPEAKGTGVINYIIYFIENPDKKGLYKNEYFKKAVSLAEKEKLLNKKDIEIYNKLQKVQKLEEMLYNIEPSPQLLAEGLSPIDCLNHLTEHLEKGWPVGDKRREYLKKAVSYARREKIT